MSSISSSLPSGLQALSNAGLLPSNMTQQQIQSETPSQLTQSAIDNVELTTVSALFGETAPASDTVSLSSSASTTDPILQALDSAMTNASTDTTSSTASTANTGSLFSYMG